MAEEEDAAAAHAPESVAGPTPCARPSLGSACRVGFRSWPVASGVILGRAAGGVRRQTCAHSIPVQKQRHVPAITRVSGCSLPAPCPNSRALPTSESAATRVRASAVTSLFLLSFQALVRSARSLDVCDGHCTGIPGFSPWPAALGCVGLGGDTRSSAEEEEEEEEEGG